MKWKYAAHLGLIRLADEGGDGGGTVTPPAAPTFIAPAAPAPATPAAPAAGTPPAPEATNWDGKVESLPEPVQKLIGDLRKENADRRTKANDAQAQQQAAVRALAKAAGIDLPDDPDGAPTVEQLTAQATAAQQAARDAAIELAVYRTATTHGGNPAALTDSRAFLAKVADLDPTAEDFTTRVTDAAKAAVTANPSLASAPAAGASSVEHPGGSGEKTPSPKNLTEAIAAHYGKSS